MIATLLINNTRVCGNPCQNLFGQRPYEASFERPYVQAIDSTKYKLAIPEGLEPSTC
ncbi:hypothetical protein DEA8626_03474 [Defluviimonas aquaemixtae]|uniref:Uncharacterized protein n=1 Tax=Albidovulum aquaemixtae TaxID=1542388 RepID=A0A2R8BLZ5_9RHOB|nr:hypothetical protein DEA8626_03474 [Defluviimonas aquaemixtae]